MPAFPRNSSLPPPTLPPLSRTPLVSVLASVFLGMPLHRQKRAGASPRPFPTHHRQLVPARHAPPQTRGPTRPLRPPRDRSQAPTGTPDRAVREVAVITRTALLRRRGVERKAEFLHHGLSSIVADLQDRSGNLQLDELALTHTDDGSDNFVLGSKDPAQVVGRKDKNRKAASHQILLIPEVLIGRDEQIELTLRQPNQISILHPTPPSLLGGGALVASEQTAHRPRNTLIQKDPHAFRRADSDRSRSWQAIWRVTDGKHSRNSSNV